MEGRKRRLPTGWHRVRVHRPDRVRVEFRPGYQLEYDVDPDGQIMPVFTADGEGR